MLELLEVVSWLSVAAVTAAQQLGRPAAVRSLPCSPAAAVLLALQSSQPVLHNTQTFSPQAPNTNTATTACFPLTTSGQSRGVRPGWRQDQARAEKSCSFTVSHTTNGVPPTTETPPPPPPPTELQGGGISMSGRGLA